MSSLDPQFDLVARLRNDGKKTMIAKRRCDQPVVTRAVPVHENLEFVLRLIRRAFGACSRRLWTWRVKMWRGKRRLLFSSAGQFFFIYQNIPRRFADDHSRFLSRVMCSSCSRFVHMHAMIMGHYRPQAILCLAAFRKDFARTKNLLHHSSIVV